MAVSTFCQPARNLYLFGCGVLEDVLSFGKKYLTGTSSHYRKLKEKVGLLGMVKCGVFPPRLRIPINNVERSRGKCPTCYPARDWHSPRRCHSILFPLPGMQLVAGKRAY